VFFFRKENDDAKDAMEKGRKEREKGERHKDINQYKVMSAE
jgi:hypothetical protein